MGRSSFLAFNNTIPSRKCCSPLSWFSSWLLPLLLQATSSLDTTWMIMSTPRRDRLEPPSPDLTHSLPLMVLSTLSLTSLTIKATALLVMPPSSPHQDPPLLAPPQHPPVLPPPPPSSKPKLLSRLCPFTPSQCNTSSSLRLLNFPRHTALPRPTMDTATMPLPESAAAVNRKSLDTTVPVTF